MNQKLVIALLLGMVFLIGCTTTKPLQFPPVTEPSTPQPENVQPTQGNTLKIANWNLQIFGEKKAGNEGLMNYYASKIKDYDVIVVQEIRDASETAFQELCNMLPEFKCIASSRAGTTSSKEQYGVIYRKVNMLQKTDYNDLQELQEKFERPPFEARFSYDDWNFTLITIHVDPDKAQEELDAVEELFEDREDEVILLGDFNTDCTYYDETQDTDFEEWLWAIPDSEDTTVAASSCTYDRILVNKNAKDNFVQSGIMKDVNKEQSDHYLVWGEFWAGGN